MYVVSHNNLLITNSQEDPVIYLLHVSDIPKKTYKKIDSTPLNWALHSIGGSPTFLPFHNGIQKSRSWTIWITWYYPLKIKMRRTLVLGSIGTCSSSPVRVRTFLAPVPSEVISLSAPPLVYIFFFPSTPFPHPYLAPPKHIFLTPLSPLLVHFLFLLRMGGGGNFLYPRHSYRSVWSRVVMVCQYAYVAGCLLDFPYCSWIYLIGSLYTFWCIHCMRFFFTKCRMLLWARFT